MSELSSGALVALVGGCVLLLVALAGVLLGVRSVARTAAATRAELAQLQARLDAGASESGSLPVLSSAETPVPSVTGLRAAHDPREAEPAVAPTAADITIATLQTPLVRVAVWSAGLRHALRPESRDRARALARREYQRRSRLRRRAARYAARTTVVTPDPATQERAS